MPEQTEPQRTSAVRYDNGAVSDWRESEEGFLHVRGVTTGTGVYPYREPSGKIRRELRHPDDVLSPESLETLKGKPATLEHPPSLLTPATVASYSVGSLSNDYQILPKGGSVKLFGLGGEVVGRSMIDAPDRTPDHLVELTFNVFRQDAIDAIRSGEKRGLSCGYRCDLIWESGVYNGQPYDCRQTNIRYNHSAITRTGNGRGGPDMVLRMDAEDAEDFARQDCWCECDEKIESVNNRVDLQRLDSKPLVNGDRLMSEVKTMARIRVDSVDYEIPPDVAGAIAPKLARLDALEKQLVDLVTAAQEVEERLDSAEDSLTAVTNERDRARGANEALQEQLNELQDELDDLRAELDARTDSGDDDDTETLSEEELEARIDKAVQARCDALDSARQILASAKEGGQEISVRLDSSMTPAEIQAAIVNGFNPGKEFSQEVIPGYYQAIQDGVTRTDTASTYHADNLEVMAAMTKSGGKKGKKTPVKELDEKRNDNFKKPMAMSKSM